MLTQNISGGPKASVTSASGSAKTSNATALSMPPTPDEIAAIFSAPAASPFCAIG
jgi:hypothetical protein